MIRKLSAVLLFNLVIVSCFLTISCSQVPLVKTQITKLPKPTYHKLASNYLQHALKATQNVDVQEYKLQACENFILAEELDQAEALLNNIEITNQDHEAYLFILKAQIALHKKQLLRAQQALQNIVVPAKLPAVLRSKFYQTRATLHLRQASLTEAVKDNIALEQQLTAITEKNLINQD